MNENKLKIFVYSSGTTPINDPDNELNRAQDIQFSNGYPGGDLDASFFVPRDVVRSWELAGAQRVAIMNGSTIVYEGKISELERLVDKTSQASNVPLQGPWATILQKRRWHKLWADSRVDEETWRWQTAATAAEKCYIDRNTRIRFTPKAEAWTSGQYAAVRYTMPTGETVKKIDYDYSLAESAGANDWELTIYNVGTTTDVVSITTTTSDTGQSHTLDTPSQSIELRFYARDNQTPTSDGTYFGQFSNIVVYSETSAINLTEVATDVVGKFTDLNSDVTNIASNTKALAPFISEWNTAADILSAAAAAGDASANRWACGLLHSDKATTPNGEPVLYVEAWPALTDYDYAVRLNEPNIVPPISFDQDFRQIANWIIVEYQDENGWTHWTTPADEATLTDATSAAAPPTGYGQRDYLLSIGYATAAKALSDGVKFLAAYKDPQLIVTSPVTIIGSIRQKSGNVIPTSHIRAGKRLKFENFLGDLSGTGLTLLITDMRYFDPDKTASLSFGMPLSPLLFAMQAPARVYDDEPESGGGNSSGGGGGDEGRAIPGGHNRTNFYNTKAAKAFKKRFGYLPERGDWRGKHKVRVWGRHDMKKKSPI